MKRTIRIFLMTVCALWSTVLAILALTRFNPGVVQALSTYFPYALFGITALALCITGWILPNAGRTSPWTKPRKRTRRRSRRTQEPDALLLFSRRITSSTRSYAQVPSPFDEYSETPEREMQMRSIPPFGVPMDRAYHGATPTDVKEDYSYPSPFVDYIERKRG